LAQNDGLKLRQLGVIRDATKGGTKTPTTLDGGFHPSALAVKIALKKIVNRGTLCKHTPGEKNAIL